MFGKLRVSDEERKEKLKPLLILKGSLQKEKIQLHEGLEFEGGGNWVEQKIEDILFRLSEMDKKIEGLRHDRMKEFMEMREFNPHETSDSIRKLKVKSMVKSLLEEHKRLTASQLSKLVNLSRTRCSEYLKELERKGLAKGTNVRRQRYYELVESK
jgi:predicted transcriptional regulator